MRSKPDLKLAQELHKQVPADWYYRSVRENWLQRFWHGRRFVEVGKMVERTEGEILDVGSADGTFTEVLARESGARKVVGVDALPRAVEFARGRLGKGGKYVFRVADAGDLPFRDGRFEAVFCLEVIEHVLDPEKIIGECVRVLKPGGYVIVLVPVEGNLLFKLIWWWWRKWRGRIWEGTHLGVCGGGELVGWAEEAGFKVEQDERFLLGMLRALKLRK